MLLRYKDFIKEAIVAFDAPNFSPNSVAQSLPATHHDASLPRHKETDATGNAEMSMMHSEVTGEYYDTFQLQDLMNKYRIWCQQNGKQPDVDSITDGPTLDMVLKEMGV